MCFGWERRKCKKRDQGYPTDREEIILVAAAASELEASKQGRKSYNLYMGLEISILPLARCMTVSVDFYRGAAWPSV